MPNSSDNKTEEVKSNVTQLINSLNQFNSVLSNKTWINSAKVEDIKTIFKLGAFIENFTKHLSSQNALQDFLNIYKIQSDNVSYKTDYLHACDSLLKKFFRTENMSEATLDIVVRVYTTMFLRDRLQLVLFDLITYSNQSECLAQYINSLPKEKAREFEFYLHLVNWKHLEEVNKTLFESELKERLSYNTENNLNVFLGILSLKNISEADKVVQKLILNVILEKMLDRSILSSCFWYALLQKSSLDIFCIVCENFKDFRTCLFNFIIYLGSMMEKDGCNWKSDSNKSLCANITYYDLLILIKNIAKFDSEFVLDTLNEAKIDTGSDIWDQIKDEICAMCNY